MTLHRTIFSASLFVAPLLAGCDPDRPPETPADRDVAPTLQASPRAPAAPSRDSIDKPSGVSIDHAVLELCDIPTPDSSFDVAKLSPAAQQALDSLATCFTRGKGRGHGLKLVGHADPRGLPDYNFALGQQRAGAVAEYIMAHGVEAERVESSSRGELDARGKDEAEWTRDRRVEILLAQD